MSRPGGIFADLPRHSFDLIFMDPPWEFKARMISNGLKKSPQAHYRCMSDEEILALPVSYLARRPCWLFLATSAPKLPLGIKCLEVWGFCVGVGTKVLTNDMRWVQAESLRVGDPLLAFDESPIGNRRYYRPSVVTSTGVEPIDSYAISLEDGREIVSSADHCWLMRSSVAGRERVMRWVRTRDIPKMLAHKTRQVPLALPLLAPMHEPDRTYEGGFLAAAFDSEGSLKEKKGGLSFAQRRNALRETVGRMLREKEYDFATYQYDKYPTGSLNINGGLRSVMRFLMEFQPPRILDLWTNRGFTASLYNMQDVAIKAVRHIGDFPCVTLSTSTGTYIAEGFGAHNTYKSRIAWHKVTKNGKSRPGPGFVVRSHHEDVLIGAIGNPPYQRAFRSLFDAPDEALDTFDGIAREHSRKPEELYRLIEEFAPGANRADIFGRQTRKNWTVWGNEATKFDRSSA